MPRRARGAFLAALPALIAVWALGGLYLSLAPSLTASVLHSTNHLVGGLAIATMTAAGTLGSIALRGRAARPALLLGCTALAAGALGTLAALALHSTPLFFTTTAIAGLGFGASFLGALNLVAPLAAPEERAELFATLYVVNYLAMSAPAVTAGLAVPHLGLLRTAAVYALVVAALALSALATTLLRRRPAPQQPSPRRPPGQGTKDSDEPFASRL
ncbi:MFS transporter [Kitasatospora griseola]|uniref:hypothetical protein n=1 Tax=Kitasatospora griseola TaxID=2064 RepID=UPI003824DA64